VTDRTHFPKHYQAGFGDAFNDQPIDHAYGTKTALYSHVYAVKVQNEYGHGYAAGLIEREKSVRETQHAAKDRLAAAANRLPAKDRLL
jgi:hypothetical protein